MLSTPLAGKSRELLRQSYNQPERERRYILERDQAEYFLDSARGQLVLADHHRHTPVAYTRTTYLDTDDCSYLRSCDAAISRRVRIREYAAAPSAEAAPTLTGACFLELKESVGPMRKKRRFAAPHSLLWHMVHNAGHIEDGWSLDDEQDELAVARIREHLASGRLSPRLTTWYRRWSFQSSTQPVRVTLDEGLAFCHATAPGAPGAPAIPEQVVCYGPSRIVEVKHRGAAPAWLEAATADLPEAKGFSKFRLGMTELRRAGEPAALTLPTKPLPIPGSMRPRSR